MKYFSILKTKMITVWSGDDPYLVHAHWKHDWRVRSCRAMHPHRNVTCIIHYLSTITPAHSFWMCNLRIL